MFTKFRLEAGPGGLASSAGRAALWVSGIADGGRDGGQKVQPAVPSLCGKAILVAAVLRK